MQGSQRDRVQSVARVAALGFVVLWLLSGRLQAIVPFWLPFALLAGMEAEFLIRGILERRNGSVPRSASRRLPGDADADLGWVETVDEEGEPILVPAPPREPRRRRLPVAVVLLIGLLLFVYAYRVDRSAGWGSISASEKQNAERRFTTEAARIAGRPVQVRCDDSYSFTGTGSDAAGVAFISRALAYLEPTICRSLYRIAFEGKIGARDEAGFAITVLAHEATHLRGIRDEAETECYALQEGTRLGIALGLPASEARALMGEQLRRDLSDASVSRVDYRLPPGCRNGGSLDLRPGDSVFP